MKTLQVGWKTIVAKIVLAVDSLFFNYDDYSLTVGDYNLTLENFDLNYNITETAYAKIESLTGMTNSLAEYKDQMVGKLRCGRGCGLKLLLVPGHSMMR